MVNVAAGIDDGNVECDVCLKEIPHSEAGIVEANDYVMYFCGLDCYRQWRDTIPENDRA